MNAENNARRRIARGPYTEEQARTLWSVLTRRGAPWLALLDAANTAKSRVTTATGISRNPAAGSSPAKAERTSSESGSS